MGFWQKIFGQSPGPRRDASDDIWYSSVGSSSIAGERVTVEKALQLPIVYACLTVLSETVGSLPFGVFERKPDSREKRDNHPLMAVLNDPNSDMTSMEFFTQMVWDLASQGNSFWEVVPGQRGLVDRLLHIDPPAVIVERLPDGSRRYRITEPGRQTRVLLEDQIWHIRDLPLIDNLVGTSRISIGKESIGAALAAQRFSAQFFKNDQTPPIAILTKAGFASADDKKNYVRAIKSWWGGAQRHSPAVMDNVETIQQLGHTAEQSQFLETRIHQANDIARLWRMPPHKVGLMDKATFSNIEQQSLEFVVDTIRPWLELIERSIDKFLMLNSQRFFFEFNVGGLLRGDIKARFESYSQARQWGWLSINEIRKLENMNPISAGDTHLQPMNMEPAALAARGPEASLFGPDGTLHSVVQNGIWMPARSGGRI